MYKASFLVVFQLESNVYKPSFLVVFQLESNMRVVSNKFSIIYGVPQEDLNLLLIKKGFQVKYHFNFYHIHFDLFLGYYMP